VLHAAENQSKKKTKGKKIKAKINKDKAALEDGTGVRSAMVKLVLFSANC
jgi:hypothetical protein